MLSTPVFLSACLLFCDRPMISLCVNHHVALGVPTISEPLLLAATITLTLSAPPHIPMLLIEEATAQQQCPPEQHWGVLPVGFLSMGTAKRR